MEPTTSQSQSEKPQFELRDNGEVHHNRKGKSTLLAKYDTETGILTFENFAIDQKYRSQVCRAIMENPSGDLTGHAVKAYRIAGRPVDKKRAGEPPRPKWDKNLGDKTPEYVRWLFRWRPQAFFARYGVFLDSNGEPVTAHCLRREQGLLSEPDGKATVIRGDGKDALAVNVVEKEDGILAMRGTCLTFTREEVVGGSGETDDPETEPDDEPIDEATHGDDAEPAGTEPIRRRGKSKKLDDEEGPE